MRILVGGCPEWNLNLARWRTAVTSAAAAECHSLQRRPQLPWPPILLGRLQRPSGAVTGRRTQPEQQCSWTLLRAGGRCAGEWTPVMRLAPGPLVAIRPRRRLWGHPVLAPSWGYLGSEGPWPCETWGGRRL
ncbi:hypothetical protein NDU88_008520 [Pleurodeles waltl]|uniref:Uncharacterized protein n=1 Tax=Pleurodeles waltl TaxID=8319 RepID=A0AAV7P5B0_PLEWA|nr:hypothetical protein NDU88_008520 [Pleurodeles waltl]